jgi:hypothetical protein
MLMNLLQSLVVQGQDPNRIRIQSSGFQIRIFVFRFAKKKNCVSDPKHWVGKTNAMRGRKYREQEEAKGSCVCLSGS